MNVSTLALALSSLLIGCAGEDGKPGPAGEAGPQGDQGAEGSAGADSEDGDPGADGEDGTPSADGEDGTPGADGEDGTPGADGEDAFCFGVDPLEFLDPGVTAAGPVVPGEEQTFTANLNETGLEVDLAFVDLDAYSYSRGTSFRATFADEGTHSFLVLATDGCSVAMDTVSIEAVTSGPEFEGSFFVHNGPHYSTGPPTYTCTEACAVVLGGVAAA
jgi:hypothetical protein